MATRLTDTKIQITVCPKRLRWPEAGTTVAWSKLHDCVDRLQRLVRTVDENCLQTERTVDLSPEGIARRRTEFGRQALTQLASFKSFQIAEQAAIKDIDALEKRRDDLNVEQAQMQQQLTKALEDLRGGVAATKRMLLERCKMRDDDDRQFRSSGLLSGGAAKSGGIY
jgi:hypothetical protein